MSTSPHDDDETRQTIAKLRSWRDSGILTEAEFKDQVSLLVNPPASNNNDPHAAAIPVAATVAAVPDGDEAYARRLAADERKRASSRRGLSTNEHQRLISALWDDAAVMERDGNISGALAKLRKAHRLCPDDPGNRILVRIQRLERSARDTALATSNRASYGATATAGAEWNAGGSRHGEHIDNGMCMPVVKQFCRAHFTAQRKCTAVA